MKIRINYEYKKRTDSCKNETFTRICSYLTTILAPRAFSFSTNLLCPLFKWSTPYIIVVSLIYKAALIKDTTDLISPPFTVEP